MLKPYKNIKLTLAYDGTNYLGWQKNKTGRSVEEALEKVLVQVFSHEITLQATSRTDAGVHAAEQVVNFFTDNLNVSCDKIKFSLNCLLPEEISVYHVEVAQDNFHPSLDCISKEYHYNLCYGKVEHLKERLYTWHYPRPLDIDKMREAIPYLIGKKDFSTFCNKKITNKYINTLREIFEIEILELPDNYLKFKIQGDNFLYKMVRNLVGTLVYIGCGRIKLEDLNPIIDKKERPFAGITAPAKGLFLYKVNFKDSF